MGAGGLWGLSVFSVRFLIYMLTTQRSSVSRVLIFRPAGACPVATFTRGLRHGLHSCAASAARGRQRERHG